MIHKKTTLIIDTARGILAERNPMTVRQVYYQLVSRQVIKNSKAEYMGVSRALVYARKEKIIPWDWVEDRLRRPRSVSMWEGLTDFAVAIKKSYRKDIWQLQKHYVELWLEKDALSGIFEDVLSEYGVTLNVGRGYDGWDSIHNAGQRFHERENEMGNPCSVLYFGDFDPSGEDMARSLEKRLSFFDCNVSVKKCALTLDDITRYSLPPDFAKSTDTRTAAFVKKNGDVSVELDALPVDVLEKRIRDELESVIDIDAIFETHRIQSDELKVILTAIETMK